MKSNYRIVKKELRNGTVSYEVQLGTDSYGKDIHWTGFFECQTLEQARTFVEAERALEVVCEVVVE